MAELFQSGTSMQYNITLGLTYTSYNNQIFKKSRVHSFRSVGRGLKYSELPPFFENDLIRIARKISYSLFADRIVDLNPPPAFPTPLFNVKVPLFLDSTAKNIFTKLRTVFTFSFSNIRDDHLLDYVRALVETSNILLNTPKKNEELTYFFIGLESLENEQNKIRIREKIERTNKDKMFSFDLFEYPKSNSTRLNWLRGLKIALNGFNRELIKYDENNSPTIRSLIEGIFIRFRSPTNDIFFN